MKIFLKMMFLWFLFFTAISLHAETVALSELFGLMDEKSLKAEVEASEQFLTTHPDDKTHLKRVGIAYHNLAVLEVDKASNKSHDYLQRAYEKDANDYEVLAYLGSAKTLVGRDSWRVIEKVTNVNEGIKIMDKAVLKVPDNAVIRILRANNSLALPRFFKRRPKAKEDFLHIETLLNRHPDMLPLTIQAEIFYKLAEIFKEEENTARAGTYMNKARKVAPDFTWPKKSQH